MVLGGHAGHRLRDPTMERGPMVRTMFECPATGEALRSTMIVGGWPAAEDASVARHCPKCGDLHRFSAADAIHVMDGGERMPPAVASPASG
jgi:hypothetical protein